MGVDPEFGEGFPQGWLFSAYTVGTWVGWWVETRMGRREGGVERGWLVGGGEYGGGGR